MLCRLLSQPQLILITFWPCCITMLFWNMDRLYSSCKRQASLLIMGYVLWARSVHDFWRHYSSLTLSSRIWLKLFLLHRVEVFLWLAFMDLSQFRQILDSSWTFQSGIQINIQSLRVHFGHQLNWAYLQFSTSHLRTILEIVLKPAL